jgi:malonyl-CoA O-methyltransferase
VDARAARRALTRLAAADEAPWLHQETARRMAERLEWIRYQPEQVLDWSGAAGASLPVLSTAYPRAGLTQVDERLLLEAPEVRLPWWRRWRAAAPAVRTVAVDEVPAASAGLVWSNMRLHFEPDPQPLLQAWRRALAPGGFLMFSTLGPGSLDLLRQLYGSAGWGAPHAPFVDMHDLGDMLVANGFAEPVMDQETINLDYRSPQALVAELRSLGANLDPKRFAGLRTPRWRDQLHERLAQRVSIHGSLRLQVELVYGHAFRSADAGPRVEPHTQIELNDMKLMLRKDKRR